MLKIKLMRSTNRLLNYNSSGVIIRLSRKQKFLKLQRKISCSRRVKMPLRRSRPKRKKKRRSRR